jgi:hypothetical protein
MSEAPVPCAGIALQSQEHGQALGAGRSCLLGGACHAVGCQPGELQKELQRLLAGAVDAALVGSSADSQPAASAVG